jgi:hypothetical protein
LWGFFLAAGLAVEYFLFATVKLYSDRLRVSMFRSTMTTQEIKNRVFPERSRREHHWIIEFIGVVYRPTATLRYRLRSPTPFSEFFGGLSEPDRLRELTDDYAEGKVSKEEIKQFVQSWFTHLDHDDTWRVRQQMLADLYWFGIDLDL